MNDEFFKAFERSLQTGYMDKNIESDVLYQPKLLVNRKNPKQKVLTSILKEFQNCEAFYISVAFVTTGGVAAIINTLQELKEQGVKGKILVSQYLNFTQPKALERLMQFDNIDLRIATKSASHSKGYIFKTKEYYNLIIGSSNLTQSALASNKEWNLQVSATHSSGIANKVIQEFKKDFEEGIIVDEHYILEYARIYDRQRILHPQKKDAQKSPIERIEPNLMQQEALNNLVNLRKSKKKKALVISATGTGKTYLAAFDAKAFNPKRMLFVVHRRNIAEKAMETFKKVFEKDKTMGLYSGNFRELDKDFIFSTVQTISKVAHLHSFNKNHFDYIIIDESHRSGAESYRTLLNYFKPKFLLGMTATPERTDGSDIFELFNHNIAYEIRLNRAMEEEMLSPFHYYGVSDLSINGESKEDITLFNQLTSEERVSQIIHKVKFYGSDNGINRGLVFCSRVEEAIELSKRFNQKGFKTIALSGRSSEEEREESIKQLESDSISGKLDYIFTVDIFNEGIDIPKVNQVIMLRPTESAIIFVQQLGRGLRKADGKSYLTVIDFIGNHQNNYLIPMALYGDSSYNKDKLRKLISEGSKELPGVSTINFDKISKERIFESIDAAKMILFKELKNDYLLLKYRLGRIPMMIDFFESETRDAFLYVEYAKSYYKFVKKVEKSEEFNLDDNSIKILEFLSKDINNAKRLEESFILQYLLDNNKATITEIQDLIFDEFEYKPSVETVLSAVHNVNLKFIRTKNNNKLVPVNQILKIKIVKVEDEVLSFCKEFKLDLKNNIFHSFLRDNVAYSISLFKQKYKANKWDNGFILYSKYARKDVFRILNFETNPVAQNVGGYLVSEDFKYCPIFVNYHKEDDISESTKYEDEFINNSYFSWMSKSNRKLDSKDVRSILGKNGDIRLPLFIKKNNDEGKDFYYMGDVSPAKDKVEQTQIKNDAGKNIPIVRILFKMNIPVSDSMYNYILESTAPKQESAIIPLKPKHQIPFYNFYAAAGTFSEMQSDHSFEMIDVLERYACEDYFACEIKGESMNRRIPNGSICLFKKYIGGSRNGKIVLVENWDYQDPDFNSAFTIKTYTSEKITTGDGWKHQSIALKPNSYDDSYQDIIINEADGENMRVVGEFITILQ